MTHPASRWPMTAALVLAPAFGLVAAVASPGLATSTDAELRSIAAQPAQFDVYAVALLVSSYLMVPAVFGVTGLLGSRSPRLGFVAGVLTQLGLLVAIGDAAVESMYAAMGRTGDRATMVALSDRYESRDRLDLHDRRAVVDRGLDPARRRSVAHSDVAALGRRRVPRLDRAQHRRLREPPPSRCWR